MRFLIELHDLFCVFIFFRIHLLLLMHVIPFQIDSGKDGAGNTVPGAADGARQYGERLGGKEVARKHRGKTGILHSYLNTDGTLLGSIEARQFSGEPTQTVTQGVVAENHGESPEEK